MGKNLSDWQANNNSKAKTKQQTQEQLSSLLSQVLMTYDFGNFENCELNTEIILIYHQLHSPLYYVCRNLHKMASFLLWSCVPLVHIDPAPSTCERVLLLQMEAHWQCGRVLYSPSSWVWKPD